MVVVGVQVGEILTLSGGVLMRIPGDDQNR